ncbi:MAG: hypothetical protein HGA69_00550 [Desulfobulbaceae bacterium]|nr:hypothetical protein [Desulfobulbaceae bacterium]
MQGKAIEFLKQVSKSTCCIDDIEKNLKIALSNTYIINQNLYPGYLMLRVRVNGDNKRLEYPQQLSYKPSHLNKTCQRASLPFNSMFYASSCERRKQEVPHGYTDVEYGLKVALFETLNEFRKNIFKANNSIDRKPMALRINEEFKGKNVTYSIWVVKELIKLARVCVFKEHAFENFTQYQVNGLFQIFFNQFPEYRTSTIDLYRLLDREFSLVIGEQQKDFDYLISAICSKVLCDMGFDGIYYPSIRCDGEGINLAIQPKIIDRNLIKCIEMGLLDLSCIDNEIVIDNIENYFGATTWGDFNSGNLLERSIKYNKEGRFVTFNVDSLI